MTQAEFRKSGWLKHFLQYDEAELATIVMLVSNLLETNCWEPTVNYCMYQMELAREEESSVPEDQSVLVCHQENCFCLTVLPAAFVQPKDNRTAHHIRQSGLGRF